MTMSEIDFFDYLFEIYWNLREHRIAYLRTRNTIDLTMILYSRWERSTCEVCLVTFTSIMNR